LGYVPSVFDDFKPVRDRAGDMPGFSGIGYLESLSEDELRRAGYILFWFASEWIVVDALTDKELFIRHFRYFLEHEIPPYGEYVTRAHIIDSARRYALAFGLSGLRIGGAS